MSAPTDSVAWAKAELIDSEISRPPPTAPSEEDMMDSESYVTANAETPLITTTTTTVFVSNPMDGLGR